MGLYLVILSLTPLLIAALQAVAVRVLRLTGRAVPGQLVVIACAAIGVVPMSAALWKVYLYTPDIYLSEKFLSCLYALIVYLLLAYSYFHLFNMSETARRIRILREIYQRDRVRAEDIAERYSASSMLTNRITRLLETGQIREVEGGGGGGGGGGVVQRGTSFRAGSSSAPRAYSPSGRGCSDCRA